LTDFNVIDVIDASDMLPLSTFFLVRNYC